MLNKINFVKMHGLGNDFVIVNKRALTNAYDLSRLAKNIADRHLGIGCDQFILHKAHDDFYEMIIYNIDSSSAKFCGNAIRCLVKLIYLNTRKSNIILKVAMKFAIIQFSKSCSEICLIRLIL